MYILLYQTWNPITKVKHNTEEISVESKDIHNGLALLESHPRISAYQIIGPTGKLSENEINHFFGGYFYPAGKAVEKFTWN